MRFMIMHKTDAHWEAGATPGPALIARVGALLGELAASGILQGAEGLRASSQGVRLTFSGGAPTVTRGPFKGDNELPAGFSILRASSIEEAIDWATRQARVLGAGEIDIRPVTEPWDIGMGAAPANMTTRRYMVLRKATAGTESGAAPTAAQRSALLRLIDEATRTGVHVVTETMRPSARGRRYTNARGGVSFFDGPFLETKEMIGGYVIVSADSLADAGRWAERYITTVGAKEVDVRELEAPA
jgi:hypothetical protein